MELEYWQCKELLDAHLQYAHPFTARACGCKESDTEYCHLCSCLVPDSSSIARSQLLLTSTHKGKAQKPIKPTAVKKSHIKRAETRKAEARVKEEEDVIRRIFAPPIDLSENSLSINSVSVGLGELAGLQYCVGKVSIGRVRVPHMVYDNLRWVRTKPPSRPHVMLTVRVDTRAYRDNDIRPPSAYRHWSADMSSLADTGCQDIRGVKISMMTGHGYGSTAAVSDRPVKM